MTNAGRQLPNELYSQITITGAIAPPTADPLSKIATAMPRSDSGNHSDTAFVAPGQFAASPAPSRIGTPQTLQAGRHRSGHRHHRIPGTANDSPRWVPSRSSSRPDTAWKIV